MKKMILYGGLSLMFLTACKTSQLSPNTDDAYTSPSEQRRLAQVAAQQQAQKLAQQQAQQEQARLAQKAKDDANPAYQDPKADPDDYYDYKYAASINRFNNPVPGAGYYDSRYTNAYTYNQDPSMYGSSIYNSYNWMPSNQFNNYSSGVGMGYGSSMMYGSPYGYGSSMGMGYGMGYGSSMMYGSPYGYGSSMGMGYGMGYGSSMMLGYGFGNSSMMMGYGYSPYGYSPYGYSPYGYSPYGFYNSSPGWGYYNSYDPNSGYSQYAPRTSSGGGNNLRNTSAGMPVESARTSYFKTVAEQQQNTPRFTESARTVAGNSNAGLGRNVPIESPHNAGRNGALNSGNVYSNPGNANYNNAAISANPRGGNSQSIRETQQQSIYQSNQNYSPNRSFNSGNSGNSGFNSGGSFRSSGGGGFSSPRGGGGGGGGGRR